MESTDPKDQMGNLPFEVQRIVLGYLSAEDLCRLAFCKKSWREMANQDEVWHPLCRKKGWERYGTVSDICKEPPFVLDTDSPSFKEGVRFPSDRIVDDSKDLIATSHWKEVYMKARHLEENWSKNHYHLVEFEFGSAGCIEYWGKNLEMQRNPSHLDNCGRTNLMILNMAAEGSYLAVSILDHCLQIWDAVTGECKHKITFQPSHNKETLKMKDGILVAGCTDGNIYTYSVETGQKLRVLSGHHRPVTRLFFDGNIIVSIAQPPTFDEEIPDIDDDSDEEEEDEFADWVPNDNVIRVWDATEGTSLCVLTYESGESRLLYFDYKDKTVAGAYQDKTICVWDACTGSLKHTLKTEFSQLISCHLGDGFIIGTNNGNQPLMKKWDMKSGELLETFRVPNAKLFKDKTFQVMRYAGYDLKSDVLLVRSAWGVLAAINLNGKYLSDTYVPLSRQNEIKKLILTCSSENKMVASEFLDGRMFLYQLSQDGEISMIRELRGVMNDELDSVDFSMACLTDTKLAFVRYFEEKVSEFQMPKILIHHYW